MRKSSLALISLIIGLFILGILFTLAEGDINPCVAPKGPEVFLRITNSSDLVDAVGVGGSAKVKVSGSVQWDCPADTVSGYILQYSALAAQTVPINRTAALGALQGNYSLTVRYANHRYSIDFVPAYNESTLVTVSLPSGDFYVSKCSDVSSNSSSSCSRT